MKDALDAWLVRQGRPGILQLHPVSRSRRHANWKVDQKDGTHALLRLSIASDGHRSLWREAAAHQRLAGSTCPRVEAYEILPEDLLGMPASLSSWVVGASGAGAMDAHPGLLPDLCYSSGQLIALLESDTPGQFGNAVVDGRFVPVRTNWALEYYAMVADWYARAHAVGADLGPMLAFLLQRLEGLLPALNTCRSFCLVHGDLRPSNLLLDLAPGPGKDDLPSYDVRGVVDWEFATMADPLLAFAMPLELPTMALAHVIDGYGRERVEEWLGRPAMMQRLEAYTIGRVVQYLALVVAAQTEDAARWGRGMAHAVRLAAERTQPGWVKAKLQAALEVDLEADVEVPNTADPVRSLVLRALGRLSCRPVVAPDEAKAWMGAIGCAMRDLDHPAEGWVKDGARFMESVRSEVAQRGYEPLRDRNKWLLGLDIRVAELGSERALCMFWLATAALVHTSGNPKVTTWPVRNHSLRGLQSLLEVMAREPAATDPRDVLFDALVALAAEQEIARLLVRDVRTEQQAARMARLLEAWEDLTVYDGRAPTALSPSEVVERGALHEDWRVPVVLVAVSKVEGLPMPPDQLIGAICHRDT
jgi:aminoglycoside phosphotransferase (APT) family kinase protein